MYNKYSAFEEAGSTALESHLKIIPGPRPYFLYKLILYFLNKKWITRIKESIYNICFPDNVKTNFQEKICRFFFFSDRNTKVRATLPLVLSGSFFSLGKTHTYNFFKMKLEIPKQL